MNKLFWTFFLSIICIYLFKEDVLYLTKQIILEKNITIEELQKENTQLHKKLLTLPAETGKIITQMHDDYLVITKINLPENTVIFGKHSVIGKITKTTKYTQKVRLITHSHSKIPVATPDIARAILKGEGNGTMVLTFIEYTSPNVSYKPGDIIYTLGIEGTFPKHHPVAIVESIKDRQTIICKPLEDISTLTHVFLLSKE
ncbi:MAG: rod shape-determining protein MreC [Alphaproteobacteria bacterium]|nr:MAG: rod shape-determining protein MreC [Alphaproteobacteria bacterium]